MATIDADAHVVENEKTWSYVDDSLRGVMPVHVNIPGNGRNTVMWAVDGRLAATGPVSQTDAVKADRELDDVPARIAHMDELHTDIQVIFPTIFLRPLTTKPQLDLAMARSYNRWLAERCQQAPDRLRWALVPPTLNVEAAVEEVRFGADNGACAVFWRGIDGERLPGDPYFDPIYAEAERLNLPICIHAATNSFTHHDMLADGGIFRFKVPGIIAFHNVLTSRVGERFPRLRFGFVELSAQWVPYALHDFVRRRRGQGINPSTLMKENRMWVACQTDDDLPYVLKYAGEDNLVAGTDYGHADTSSELEALIRMREREDVSPEAMNKILDDNARALYAL
jgi:predicted TIM-barrel fold metal-dependent hydrolase